MRWRVGWATVVVAVLAYPGWAVADTVDGLAAGSGPLAGGTTTELTVVGRGGVPSVGVGSVALNVTVTNPTASGFLTVWPAGSPRPNASNLNFSPGQTVPNMVTVPVGQDGKVSIYASAGTSDVIVDVLGWFPTGTSFAGLTPARLMDTRPASGASTPSPSAVTVSSAGVGWPSLDIRWRPPTAPTIDGYLVRYRATGTATWLDADGTPVVLADGRRLLTVTTPAVTHGTLYEATVQSILAGRPSQPIRAEGWVYKATCTAKYSTFLSTPSHVYLNLSLVTDSNGASPPLTDIALTTTISVPGNSPLTITSNVGGLFGSTVQFDAITVPGGVFPAGTYQAEIAEQAPGSATICTTTFTL